MKDWPKKGDKMRFMGKNGYDSELERAKDIFHDGGELIVKCFYLGGWSSAIEFEGFKGRFNSVMFEKVQEE